MSGSSDVRVALEVLAHQRRHGAGVEEGLAAHGRAARVDEVAVGGGLEHVARGSGAQRLEEELLVLVHREHEDPQPGLADGELARRLQAGHAGHRDVEDHEVHVVRERPLDRLRPVVDLGDDAEVGLAVEQLAQPVAHDRMIVGEEHAGDQRRGHRASLIGSRNATSVPCGSSGAHAELRADEQRPLAHATDPARVVRDFCGQADAVVTHRQHHPAIVVRLEGDHDPASLRVPDDVGEALLGDPVDDQLLLGGEREVAGEPSLDLEPRSLGDRRAQSQQRALEPELVERLGTEPAGDQPDLLRRLTRTLAEPDDVFAKLLGSAPRQRLATQDQPGQELADLVVQLPRDAPPLGLLGRQSAAPAVAPLALEAIEHLIEGFRQRHNLFIAGGGVDPLTRSERVDLVHDLGQGLQRRQRSSEKGVEEHQRHGEPAQDHRQLGQRRRHRHRDRRQHQHGDGETDHGRVREEQPAEQRRAARRPRATRRTLKDGRCGSHGHRTIVTQKLTSVRRARATYIRAHRQMVMTAHGIGASPDTGSGHDPS